MDAVCCTGKILYYRLTIEADALNFMVAFEMTFDCKLCVETFSSQSRLVKHYKLRHGHFAKLIPLPCIRANCQSQFRSVSSWNHHRSLCRLSFEGMGTFFRCVVASCNEKCSTFALFNKHLKSHLDACQVIACPFLNCEKTFSVWENFRLHKRRHHGDVEYLKPNIRANALHDAQRPSCSGEANISVNTDCDATADSVETLAENENESVSEHDIFSKITMFLLQLQVIENIPASTIQNIVDSFGELFHLTLDEIRQKCKDVLSNFGISAEIADILSDSFSSSTVDDCLLSNEGILSTHKRRQTYFLKNMEHVAPSN